MQVEENRYLSNYVFNGQEIVTMQLVREEQHHDEIRQFQDGRYISASEAIWRLFQFKTIYNYPLVMRFKVYSEIHYAVYFREMQQSRAIRQS